MARKGTPISKSPAPTPEPAAASEQVVMTRRETAFRESAGRFLSAAGENVGGVEKLLSRHKATLVPIFGPTEERVLAQVARMSEAAQASMEDLSVFYRVEAPAARLEELQGELAANELVEAAYVKPPVALPRINDM